MTLLPCPASTPSRSWSRAATTGHLARMETQIAVDAILDRLPNVRLDPSAEDVHITGKGFRAPRRLPVVFDV